MFDINAIITQALNAAVQQATAPLLERIAALEDQAIVTSNRINDRISSLETKLTEANLFTKTCGDGGLTRDQVEALIEKWMDDHTSQYDHDSYDDTASKVYETDFDDFVTNDSIEDAVRDAVGNLSFEVSVS